MSEVILQTVKDWLRVIHSDDDGLLQSLIEQAEDEALRFLDRTQAPTLPVDYPPEYDSSSNELSEDDPSSGDPIARSFEKAVCILVQAYYESPTQEERDRMRRAAELVLFPYRAKLGV